MLRHITFTVFITTSMNTLATGMVPETSVLLVDEKRGEASINIKNTDDHPSLLYTTIVDLPESNKSPDYIPSQPILPDWHLFFPQSCTHGLFHSE